MAVLNALTRFSAFPFGHTLPVRVRHLYIPFRRSVAKVAIERVRMRVTSERATLCARWFGRWRKRRVVEIAHVKSIPKTSTVVNALGMN